MSLNIEETYELLKFYYADNYNIKDVTKIGGAKGSKIHSLAIPMLVGYAGIGKTQIVSKFCDEFNYYLVYFNVNHIQTGDLAMPFKTAEDKVNYALNHKLQEILDIYAKDNTAKFLIFFDEFNRGSEDVRSELMTVIHDRNIYGVQLPDTVEFCAAMNPSEDMTEFSSGSYTTNEIADDAHRNRFAFINIDADPNAWLKWGEGRLHPYIQKFFSVPENRAQYFYGRGPNDTQLATPRTWEEVSRRLYQLTDNNKKTDWNSPIVLNLIGGLIGESKRSALISWITSYETRMVDIAKIFKGETLTEDDLEVIKEGSVPKKKVICDELTKAYKEADINDITALTVRDIINVYRYVTERDLQYTLAKSLISKNIEKYHIVKKFANELDETFEKELYNLVRTSNGLSENK